jgi:Family of unknown function (DUF6526)
MATQTYATHRHAPRTTGIGFAFLIIGIVGFALRGYGIGGHVTMAVGLFGLVACNLVLLAISRTYTTALQDRIINLEMRVRCASFLTPQQQAILSRLDKAQVIALRFASDAELPALAEQAEREHLSADQIKRAIKSWVPDLART